MAQKKQPTRKKAPAKGKGKNKQTQHALPHGFWSQVGAVILIVISIFYVLTWFDAGGPALEWLHDATLATIGYGMYVLPILLTYLSVEIFRASNNKVPFFVKFGIILMVLWFAGLFGLFTNSDQETLGGWIGRSFNDNVMLQLVTPGVGGLIYVVLILVTTLLVLRLSPAAVIEAFRNLVRTADPVENTKNVNVMRRAASADEPKSKPVGEITLNAGVPVLGQEPDNSKQPKAKLPKRGKSKDIDVSMPAPKPEDTSALVSVRDPNWQAPSLDILERKQNPADPGDVQQNAKIIKDTLSEFNIDVEMEGANVGPKVTQYTLRPPSGVKLSKISALDTNLALSLAARMIRIEAPIPGQRAVGIEVPNAKAADVRLYGVLTSQEWNKSAEPLSFAIGKDISGDPVVGELNKMPHLLVAGQTGSGKSVMINTLLCSLLFKNSPSEMKMILVDPKQVEMARYRDIPHLLTPIITDPEKTVSALKWAVNEMERRYKLLAEEGYVNIETYNRAMQKSRKKIAVKDEDGFEQRVEDGAMPYIVIVIDEMADLMMVASKDVESLIVRLAQKARAIGIHLVLATQSPRADVITGLIKANVPAKIAFTVNNQVDSRIILDQVGAEKLLGQGDMLFKTASMGKPIRVQGAWVMDSEVKKIADHLRGQSEPQYNDEIISQPVQLNGKGGVVMDMNTDIDDPTYKKALELVVAGGKASTSLLQRRLGIGYSKAARYIDTMEDQGVIGPSTGTSKPREVLISSVDDIISADD